MVFIQIEINPLRPLGVAHKALGIWLRCLDISRTWVLATSKMVLPSVRGVWQVPAPSDVPPLSVCSPSARHVCSVIIPRGRHVTACVSRAYQFHGYGRLRLGPIWTDTKLGDDSDSLTDDCVAPVIIMTHPPCVLTFGGAGVGC
jgi:hypothetical protein